MNETIFGRSGEALLFRPARTDEIPAVCDLYEAAKAEPYSVWDEEYPTDKEACEDRATGGLYVLTDASETVIGALSVVPDNETDGLPCWQVDCPGVREIARIVVHRAHHGRGYAALMVARICMILRAQGCPAVHISVAVGNAPALATYPKVGFVPVGKAELFGGHYILMERILDDAAT